MAYEINNGYEWMNGVLIGQLRLGYEERSDRDFNDDLETPSGLAERLNDPAMQTPFEIDEAMFEDIPSRRKDIKF